MIDINTQPEQPKEHTTTAEDNIQRAFHDQLRISPLAAANFLAENTNANRKLARTQSRKLYTKYATELTILKNSRENSLATLENLELLTKLYGEYSQLSKPRKTKNSFKQYVTAHLDKDRNEEDDLTAEENQGREAILKHTVRGRHEVHEGGTDRHARPHFKNESEVMSEKIAADSTRIAMLEETLQILDQVRAKLDN